MLIAMPVMLLPSTIPSSGMAYWGVYQGSGPMNAVSASTVTLKPETNIDTVPSP